MFFAIFGTAAAPRTSGDEKDDVEIRWATVRVDGRHDQGIKLRRSNVRRDGKDLVRTEIGSLSVLETQDAELIELRWVIGEEGDFAEVSAEARGDRLLLTFKSHDGSERKEEVPYDRKALGPFETRAIGALRGFERLVRGKGLAAETTYEARFWVLENPEPFPLTFAVAGKEAVDVLGEKMELTRIDVQGDDPKRTSSVWVDGDGKVVREVWRTKTVHVRVSGPPGGEGVREAREETTETEICWFSDARAAAKGLDADLAWGAGGRYSDPRHGLWFRSPEGWSVRKGTGEAFVEVHSPEGERKIRVWSVEFSPEKGPEGMEEALVPLGFEQDPIRRTERRIGNAPAVDFEYPSDRVVVVWPLSSYLLVFAPDKPTEDAVAALEELLDSVGLRPVSPPGEENSSGQGRPGRPK